MNTAPKFDSERVVAKLITESVPPLADNDALTPDDWSELEIRAKGDPRFAAALRRLLDSPDPEDLVQLAAGQVDARKLDDDLFEVPVERFPEGHFAQVTTEDLYELGLAFDGARLVDEYRGEEHAVFLVNAHWRTLTEKLWRDINGT